MKLGNRKVVIGGLTAVAFTSLTAFTNVKPDTTSDTNLISTAPSVNYQSLAMAEYGGISSFSTLFMPGQMTTTLDDVKAESTISGDKNPVNTQAGVAKLFTQSDTLDSVGNVVENNNESNKQLNKAALNNETVGEEAEDATQNNAAADSTSNEEDMNSKDDENTQDATSQETVSESQTDEMTEEAVQDSSEDSTQNEDTKEEQTEEEDQTSLEEEQQEESEWNSKVMANVEKSVNIRAEANEDSEIVGKLYKGAQANILEKGDEWTKISSGSVSEGYVKNNFLAFDDEAEALAKQDGTLVATVNTNALRIRSEASEDSSVIDLAENGEELTAVEEDGDWVQIHYSNDKNAYVSSQFVSVDYVLGKAVTLEEDEAIKEEKKRKEAEARKKEIEASEDAAILAAVVRMEAGGESYDGKLAVASVVVNRMRSGGYPNSVSGVVYQSGQFPGAANGTLASYLSGGVGGDCKKAAVEALSGLTNVDYLHFNSVSRIGTNGYVLGNHCFY